MQWLAVCSGILLFICSTRADAVCSVPDDKKALVSALELDLAHTVAPCIAPDPSVLLALNLGKNFNSKAIKMLKEQLVEDAVKKVNQGLTFTSGKVALYVLALRSSCFDPTNLPCSSGKINLVHFLKTKTQDEITSIKKKGSPLTTYYQVSLDVLALCVMSSTEAFQSGEALAKYIPKDPGVDTAAVAAMACTCVLGMGSLPSTTMEALKLTLSQLITLILNAQQPDGTIGNIYSTGLAGQALTAAQAYYPKEEWKCSSTMNKVLSEIPKNTFSLPGPASQVLPFLQGKSYVNVKGMQCAHVPSITVEFTILNDLTGENFKYSTEVSVPEGSTLLQVMEKAAENNPKEFSFTTEQSSFGAYVTSINHLYGSTNEKTYWQFFSGHVPLDKGVSTYIPVNEEHILAIFSKY